MNIAVDLPIEDGPKWLSHIEVSRQEDGRVALRIVKHSGSDYGAAVVAEDDLRKALEIV